MAKFYVILFHIFLKIEILTIYFLNYKMKNAREYKNQRERDEALGSFLNPRQGRFFSNIE